MIKRLMMMLAVLSMSSHLLFGQTLNTHAPLKVGEKIPDLKFVLHKGKDQFPVSLTDYKGKIILFDFWSTGCASCISAMPHMLELQEKFKDKIQIILVAKESMEKIDNLWVKLKGVESTKVLESGQKLPFIVSDTVLNNLFPNVGLPMHTWIDQDQTFISSARSNSTTVDNIQLLLNREPVNFSTYYIPEFQWGNFKGWFDRRIGFKDHLLTYSFIAKFDRKVHASGNIEIVKDSGTNQPVGLQCLNRSVSDLYRMAYFSTIDPTKNIVVFEVKNNDKYYWPDDESKLYNWLEENTYCYVSKIKVKHADDVFNVMKTDLDRYFNLNSKFEVRKVKCYILKRISTIDKIATKGGEEKAGKYEGASGSELIYQNLPIVFLPQDIETYYLSRGLFGRSYATPQTQYFDETNYAKNIDLKLPLGSYDVGYSIPQLKKNLQKFGLDLVEEYRDMKVLVIRDNANEN